ncbi:MAG: Gfo/Idh/MocA family oxidoreductase [Raoultibacter sp.]
MNKRVTIGMVGAGRGTELHMCGYDKVYGIEVRRKWIFARRIEQLQGAQSHYGFERYTVDYDDLLNDPEVDVIDICTPPYIHVQEIVRALKAGKHVICEKPLTGYFGADDDEKPIGAVSKEKMYKGCLENLRQIEEAVKASDKQFMYAENFVYAPAIIKAAEIIKAKKSRILYMKGEESLKGSSSPVAGEWEKTGGGTFIRTGTHPLAAILWLKQQEAEARGAEICAKSVLADMARVTPSLSEYEHRHIAARPKDVEDIGTVILEFSDGTRAVVIATDTLLGGSRNYVELYCNDAAINCTLTLNNLMSSYFLDEDGLDSVGISEMLPNKTGWNHPFIEDEIVRGYVGEIQDFMEAVALNRKAKSGFEVARDTAKIVYAAYLSAESGQRVKL